MNAFTSSEPPIYERPPKPVRVALPAGKPYVTYGLLAITAFVFLLQSASQLFLGGDLPAFLGDKYTPDMLAGQVWRFLTPVFLHGSLYHIAFNMLALFNLGRGQEARFGHLRFTALYFLGAFSGNVLSFLLTPAASLGASTAIFALIAAEGIFLYQNRKLLGAQAARSLGSLALWGGINLFLGFTSSGIDNWGHVGGLAGGLLFAWFGGPRWKVEGLYPQLYLTDERHGNGLWAGTAAVLLVFLPLAALGWLWLP
ncbi:MAG: rhomboid family intramembrane serine protease [Chloroflexi bacterium]|nr:rhomboid family intramembrane serine protease [Chloroflexota bacterium]